MSAGSSSPTTRSSGCFLDRLAQPDAATARSSTASRGRAPRPRRSTRRWPRRGQRVDRAAATSTCRSRTSSAAWPAAGSASATGHVYNDRVQPAREPGHLRPRRLAARSSAPTTSRGDRPRPDGAAAAARSTRSSTTTAPPGILRTVDGRQADRRRRRATLTRRRSATGAPAPDGHPQVARRDRADAPRRARSSPRSWRSSRPSSSRASRRPTSTASPSAHIRAPARVPSFKGYPGVEPAPAVPGQRLHLDRRRGRPRHPRRRGPSARARSCRSTPARSSTAGTATARGRSIVGDAAAGGRATWSTRRAPR